MHKLVKAKGPIENDDAAENRMRNATPTLWICITIVFDRPIYKFLLKNINNLLKLLFILRVA